MKDNGETATNLSPNRLLLIKTIESDEKDIECVEVANYINYDKYGEMFENFVAKVKTKSGNFLYLFKGGTWKGNYNEKVYCFVSEIDFDIKDNTDFVYNARECQSEEFEDLLDELESEEPNWLENIVYNIVDDDLLVIRISKINPALEEIEAAIKELECLKLKAKEQ